MIKKPTEDLEGATKEHIEFIQEELVGIPLELGAAPVAATPLLEDNEFGIYSNSLYVRKGATIYVFSSDSTITIT